MALLPHVVARNWRLKLAAFGLTVVLWVVVRSDAGPTSRETLRSVPIQVTVSDPNWTLAEDPDPLSVEVRISGRFPQLMGVTREGASLRIPIDQVTSRDTVIELLREWVVLDGTSDIVVQDILPGTVTLSFARTESRTLPVAARMTEELPGGTALAAPIGLNPEVVRVRGPTRRVLALDSVPLLPFDLSSVRESGIYEVLVDTARLAGLVVTPTSVNLGIRLEPATERVVAGVPVEVEPPEGALVDSAWTVLPATIQLTLRGARTPVQAVGLDDVRAVVPRSALAGMSVGEERKAPIRLRGVPPLIRAYSAVDSVLVARLADVVAPAATPTAEDVVPPDGGSPPSARDTATFEGPPTPPGIDSGPPAARPPGGGADTTGPGRIPGRDTTRTGAPRPRPEGR